MEKSDSIIYRPLYDLAITLLEEKISFIKYEPLAQTMCKSIDVVVQKFNTTGKKFEMPKKYR